MRALKNLFLIGLLGLPLAACSGEVVDVAKSPQDDAGPDAETGTPPVPESGTKAETGGDDGGEWDGWSAGFASSSSGPPPACASAALACGAAFPGQSAFTSSQDAANALVGQWSFCGQAQSGFYPPDQLGEEYAADGTYYELIAGSNGALVRNMDPQTISTWQVDLTPNNGIEVHTSGGGVQRSGGLSDCPPSLVMLGVEARLD
jgi:hypothetical protein